MNRLRIGFIGTGEIGIPFLRSLMIDPHFELCFVITKNETGVTRLNIWKYLQSIHTDIPIYTPTSMNDYDINWFTGLNAVVVIAYGYKIPSCFLKMSCWINIHGSCLPRLRGAAPIQHALTLGMQVTGLSVVIMTNKMDAGPVISTLPIPIKLEDNFLDICHKMGDMGADWFCKILYNFLLGKITPEPQDDNQASYAPMITKEFRTIDWSQDATAIYNKIRALSPYPYALSAIGGFNYKAVKCALVDSCNTAPHGSLISPSQLIIICNGNSAIRITELIPAGGRLMTDEEFCRGHKIPVYDKQG